MSETMDDQMNVCQTCNLEHWKKHKNIRTWFENGTRARPAPKFTKIAVLDLGILKACLSSYFKI